MATKATEITALEADLAEVNAAISNARKASSLSTGSRSVTWQNLKDLKAERREIKQEIAELKGIAPKVAGFDMRGNF